LLGQQLLELQRTIHLRLAPTCTVRLFRLILLRLEPFIVRLFRLILLRLEPLSLMAVQPLLRHLHLVRLL
jgi:hypothetical protein